jgi:adenosine deaminase
MIDIYNTYADHPIDRLYRIGLSVGVNSDARTLANVSLSQEYARLQQTFGWGPQEFCRCNRYALKAAFVPEGVRQALLTRLEAGYQGAL